MPSRFTFLIKSSILHRHRQLTIHPDYLSFDDKDLISAKPTTIEKALDEILGGITAQFHAEQ